METIVRDCKAVLESVEAEISLCQQMTEMLARERRALASMSYADLTSCIRERQLLEAEWRRVARQRRSQLGKLLPGKATLQELAKGEPAEAKQEILGLAARLRGLIFSVKREQRINLALVRSSLGLVTEVLGLLRGGAERCYDATASMVGSGNRVGGWRA